jgi:hypothetical protein
VKENDVQSRIARAMFQVYEPIVLVGYTAPELHTACNQLGLGAHRMSYYAACIKISGSTGGIADRARGVVIQGNRLVSVDAGYGIFRDFSVNHTDGTVIQANSIEGNVSSTGTGIYCGTAGTTTENNLVIQGNSVNENISTGVDATCRSGELIQDKNSTWFSRRLNWAQTGNLASAATIVLAPNGNVIPLTGTATITTITCAPCTAGAVVVFIVQGAHAPVMNEGGNIRLDDNLSNAWTGADGASIALRYNGTTWFELFRKNS